MIIATSDNVSIIGTIYDIYKRSRFFAFQITSLLQVQVQRFQLDENLTAWIVESIVHV